MVVPRIQQFLLRRYLLFYPLQRREVHYLSLARWSWLKPSLDIIKPEVLPVATAPPGEAAATPNALLSSPGVQPFPGYYQQYACQVSNPLNCAKSLGQPVIPGEAICQSCGFPQLLQPQTIIVGNRGRYRVERCLGQRGIGRLYAATQLGSEQPVTIKEYLLPRRYFTDQERQQRQEIFLKLAGLTLADGRHTDLRAIFPLDAIAPPLEDRCYLITPVDDQSLTFSTLLTQRLPLTAAEVWQVLNQVLQTLACLHGQKFSLPMGQVQVGVTHGRLSLSSLLWVAQGPSWFVYLTDFSRWERIFDPMASDVLEATPQQDLIQLGQTAFYLLQGRLTDAAGNPLDPKMEAHWLPCYPPLKALILRLLGIEAPFENAESARQSLLSIPPEPTFSAAVLPLLAPAPQRSLSRYWVPALGVLAVVGLFAGIAWLLVRSQRVSAVSTPSLCCLKDVAAVPAGTFTEVSVAGDLWSQINEKKPLGGATSDVIQLMRQAHPTLTLEHQAAGSIATALDQLRQGQADVAILPLLSPLPIEFEAQVVAYDGLAVVVPFSYAQRDQNLPEALQGAITLADLRKIYTGRADHWPGRSVADLPIRAYVPSDRGAIDTFEQQVLQQDQAIADFEGLIASPDQRLDTIPLLRSILRDFEVNRVGSIGFAPLSAIVSQCSIYPLAIQAAGQPPAQPLVMDDGQPIQPSTDLCRLKGSYGIDAEALRSHRYPLAYPLVVVWLRDNRHPPVGKKIAELLLTDEGQQQLQQLGLVTRTVLPSGE